MSKVFCIVLKRMTDTGARLAEIRQNMEEVTRRLDVLSDRLREIRERMEAATNCEGEESVVAGVPGFEQPISEMGLGDSVKDGD